MKRLTFFLFLIGLLVLGTFFLFKEPSVEVTSEVKESDNSVDKSEVVKSVELNTSNKILPSKKECELILRKIINSRWYLSESTIHFSNSLLRDYSKDNVLKAVALIDNSFAAYRLSKRLIDQSSYSEQRELQIFGNTLPDNVSFSFSSESIKSLLASGQKKFQAFLDRKLLSTENLSSLIKSGDLSEGIIIRLFDGVKDVNEPILDSANFQPTNLLESIIHHGTARMFDKFIEKGGTIKNSDFSVNALERLIFTHPSLNFGDKQPIFDYLKNMNLVVRLGVTSHSNFKVGNIFTFPLAIPKDEKTTYKQKLVSSGLSIVEPTSISSLEQDEEVMLIYDLYKDFLKNNLFRKTFEFGFDDYQYCRSE